MVAAIVLHVGFAGYGAFYVASEGDGTHATGERFEDGFGIHAGFGYLVVLIGLAYLLVTAAARQGRQRILWTAGLFGLLILQVLLAWFGFEVPFIGFFHPINALALFALSTWLAWTSWR